LIRNNRIEYRIVEKAKSVPELLQKTFAFAHGWRKPALA
jgi:hypothetical protein